MLKGHSPSCSNLSSGRTAHDFTCAVKYVGTKHRTENTFLVPFKLGDGCHSHFCECISQIVITCCSKISQMMWVMFAETTFYSTCQGRCGWAAKRKVSPGGGEVLRTAEPWVGRGSRNWISSGLCVLFSGRYSGVGITSDA